MNDETLKALGKLVPDEMARDAVHVAVVPMLAAISLKPGQHVGTDGHGRISASEPHIGVVDPYLRAPLKAGDRCWLFLYPGSITSLRHEWTHPALGATAAPASGSKSASEQWMRKWAMEHVSEDYYGEGKKSEDDALKYAIEAGRNQHIGPYESARDYIDNEWWSHWEIITGQRGDRDAYFSCGC